VQENLAKDHHKEYDGRGIIILREKDERLEYALSMSMMPKVSLFQYCFGCASQPYFSIQNLASAFRLVIQTSGNLRTCSKKRSNP
jgi:hypothetical protein